MYDERLISAFCQATKRDEIMKLAQIGKVKYYKLRADPDFMNAVKEAKASVGKGMKMQKIQEIYLRII